MRVATIGGGHGQAALLTALRQLDCAVTAVVSVADDGGCSGRLRDELGIAPPGDMRRCLSALAADRQLAARFESRLEGPGLEGRSAGNLVLAEAWHELGGLQAAVDWAAELLQCRGRVVAAAEEPGVLAVYDQETGEVEGETAIARQSRRPLVVGVHGPRWCNPAAAEAIEAADWILIGPGSFVTSILATLATADLCYALGRTGGRCVLLANLGPEGNQLAGFATLDYVRLLRDHITIHSRGLQVPLAVLCHHDGDPIRGRLDDGTPSMGAPLAAPGTRVHEPTRVADALVQHLGLARRPPPLPALDPEERARAHDRFSACLARARARLD